MTISISNIIADEITDSVVSSEFPGLQIPTAYNDYLQRIPLESCLACPKSINGYHKCWKEIAVKPANQRQYLQDQIDKGNAIREKLRILQNLICLFERVGTGIVDITEANKYSGPVYTDYGGWHLNSASGNTVSLTYVAGSTNPNALTWNDYSVNPDWVQGDPANQKYITTSIPGTLSVKSILTFNNGYMKEHCGHIVQRIVCDKNIQVGQSFTIYLDTPVSSLAIQHAPNENISLPITVKCRMYTGAFMESWLCIKDFFYKWFAPRDYVINNPQNQLYNICNGRILLPMHGSSFFSAKALSGSTWNDMGFDYDELYVAFSNGTAQSCLDLTNKDLSGITQIKLSYYAEDNYAGDFPFYAGCINCTPDYSNSFGKANGSIKYYCSKANDVLSHGGQSFITNFQKDCCASTCPFYQVDKFTSINDINMYLQLLYSHPWKMQTSSGETIISRSGVPSLGSLSGLDLKCYNILDDLIQYDYFKTTMPKQCVWTDENGNSQLNGVIGSEQRTVKDNGQGLAFGDQTTVPPFGPFGGNITGRIENYGTGAVNSTTDFYNQVQSQGMLGTIDINRYDFSFTGHLGQYQRFRSTKIYFPRIQAGTDQQLFDDGLYQRLFADTNRNIQTSLNQDGVTTVYFGKISNIKSLRYSKSHSENNLGGSFTANVFSTTYGSNQLTINLVNKTTTVTIQSGPGTTRPGTCRVAGNNVPFPSGLNIRNVASNQNYVGPGNYGIRTGMVSTINGKKYWVVRVSAGSGDRCPYDPSTLVYNGTADNAFYDGQYSGAILPDNHKLYGSKCDQVVLQDENGTLATTTLAQNTAITFDWSGVLLPVTTTVYVSDPAGSDTAIPTYIDYASGTIWLKQDIPVNQCVYVDCYLADRTTIPVVSEFNSLIRTMEKLLSE